MKTGKKKKKEKKKKKGKKSKPSLGILIKSPIQVLTAPNWLDFESTFICTFLPLDHSSTRIRHNSHWKTMRRID